ncbi:MULTISPECIES: hypothetical protein [Pseudomonas]|uniref:hypothetical protein n=1 Tax=Pseudomonas TaxID=286 RepID=UPI001E2FDB8E|nr:MULTISPECIES: hypothetical protein [Pseudomonas]
MKRTLAIAIILIISVGAHAQTFTDLQQAKRQGITLCGGGMQEFAKDELPEIAAKMTDEQIEKSKKTLTEWKATRPPLSFFPDKL